MQDLGSAGPKAPFTRDTFVLANDTQNTKPIGPNWSVYTAGKQDQRVWNCKPRTAMNFRIPFHRFHIFWENWNQDSWGLRREILSWESFPLNLHVERSTMDHLES